MKSIMEEASTLIKAIENAWNRAGKPQEFSVKILEYPETGFLGLKTIKSAKIALFFAEVFKPEPAPRPQPRRDSAPQARAPRPPERPQERQDRPERRGSYQQNRPQRPDNRRDGRYEQRSIAQPDTYNNDQRNEQRPEPRYPERPVERRAPEPRPAAPRYQEQRPEAPRPTWSADMVATAQEWLKETLVLTGLEDAGVKSHVSQGFLKLIVEKPVSDDPRQEELLLRSWSGLAFDALQEKFNQPLHGLRLVIETKRG